MVEELGDEAGSPPGPNWTKVQLEVRAATDTRLTICQRHGISLEQLSEHIRTHKWSVPEERSVEDRALLVRKLLVGLRARQGKWVRAEPVAALYAGGRVFHAPGLLALEDEMCAFGADGLSEGHSPDRVDALVWALTELMLKRGEPRIRGI